MSFASQQKSGMVGPSEIHVGRFTYGFESTVIRQWGEGARFCVGSFCSIADGVNIYLGGNHRVDWATTFPFGHVFTKDLDVEGIVGHPRTNGDVIIGNDVWIGSQVAIMSGVRIGDGAVVAAKSVVVKDIAPYEVWGGNPAQKVKTRFPDPVVKALLELRWWDMEVATIRAIAPLLSRPPTLEGIAEIRATAGL